MALPSSFVCRGMQCAPTLQGGVSTMNGMNALWQRCENIISAPNDHRMTFKKPNWAPWFIFCSSGEKSWSISVVDTVQVGHIGIGR